MPQGTVQVCKRGSKAMFQAGLGAPRSLPPGHGIWCEDFRCGVNVFFLFRFFVRIFFYQGASGVVASLEVGRPHARERKRPYAAAEMK